MANGRNQKKINEAKMDRMRWRRNGELLTAEMTISRKPFGEFDLHFKMNPTNGKTDVAIVNGRYSAFNASLTYESYNEAVKGVAEYFDQIDECVKKLPKSVIERAENAKTEIISLAIRTQMILTA